MSGALLSEAVFFDRFLIVSNLDPQSRGVCREDHSVGTWQALVMLFEMLWQFFSVRVEHVLNKLSPSSGVTVSVETFQAVSYDSAATSTEFGDSVGTGVLDPEPADGTHYEL